MITRSVASIVIFLALHSSTINDRSKIIEQSIRLLTWTVQIFLIGLSLFMQESIEPERQYAYTKKTFNEDFN